MIEILDEEEEGWWRGRRGTSEGVFPSNFVEELLDDSKPVHQKGLSPDPPSPMAPVVNSQTGERRKSAHVQRSAGELTQTLHATMSEWVWSEHGCGQ